MQRLRLDALQDRAGRLHLHRKPFTGIAYEVKSDRVTANYRVTEGVRNGPAEAWDPNRPRVLLGALTIVSVDETDEHFPEEGTYLDGAPFHGIAYSFDRDTGALLKEEDLHPTQRGLSREWYPSGARKAESDRAREDGTYESEAWYENGQSTGIESRDWGFSYTSEGRLRTLRLDRGYPKKVFDQITFRADSMLFLAGPGVTDEVLERLEDLPRVKDLELSRTRITARGLERFYACMNLTNLTTRGNRRFTVADVRKVLARIPNCEWDRR
jgi:hypothetical protein